ncbi:rna-directed dna polymerase from mobile element jockey-like [Pitangus sulphuratus]|nr:rna-directed dna polymerase from mobile element jockey-like [Pitangus sulphuratus]
MDSEIECTLSNFANTKLCDTLNSLEGKNAIQRDPVELRRWACANLKKFNKEKCKTLQVVQGNPKCKYRLDGKWINSSPAEKDRDVS